MNAFKQHIKRFIWAAFAICPGQLRRTTSRTVAKCCPLGEDIVFDGYLNEFAIRIDNARFIEQQVLHAGYETWLQRIIERYVTEFNSVCFDIGANAGIVTMMLAKQMKFKGKVIAFEASPPFFERLLFNISLNSELADVVMPINTAVSDTECTLCWHEDPCQPGNGIVDIKNGIRIPAITIDEFVERNGIDRLDFVKIDVEGMEHEVLRGGGKTWRRFRPVIVFETLPSTPDEKGYEVYEQIDREFSELGYGLYSIQENGTTQRASPSLLTHNSLLVPLEQGDNE